MEFETRTIKMNGKSLILKKPKLTRKIDLTSRSNRGLLPSLKEPNNIINYESQLEHDFYLLLDHDPHCLEIISQPRLNWTYNPVRGSTEEIIPDTWALFKTGQIYIFEIKTESQLKKLTSGFLEEKLKSPNIKERNIHRERKNWQLKQQAIRMYCRDFGYKYMIFTEKRIRSPRLDNIKDLLKDGKHWPIEKIRLFNPKFVSPKKLFTNIGRILIQDPNITVKELTNQLTINYENQHSFEVLLAILKHHIYHGRISIDWNAPFVESILTITGKEFAFTDQLVPTYQISESAIELISSIEISLQTSSYDTKIIPLMLQELELDGKLDRTKLTKDEIFLQLSKETHQTLRDIFQRLSQKLPEMSIQQISTDFGKWKKQFKEKQYYNFIKPLISLFNTNESITKQDVLEYCTSDGKYNGIGLDYNKRESEKAYRLFLQWKKKNIYGIEDPKVNQKRKSKFPEPVQTLLMHFTSEWNTNRGYMLTNYKRMVAKLKQLIKADAFDTSFPIRDKDIPSYYTFRNYCNSLPKKEKIGKFDSGVQKDIKRGLFSFYKEGRYPGAVIQIDHTQLDIWVVSYADRKAYARPWVTLAVDVYSRAIWGIYISDRPPNQENNIKCLLSGLLDKNDIFAEEWNYIERFASKNGIDLSKYNWVANGLPARIQVDNGKDFDSRLMKQFCTKLGITLEFRPIKTPEYGGFVESIWDTINDAVRERSKEFGGVVFSQPKQRQVVSRVNWKTPKDYDPKQTAKLTLDMLKEWLLAYIVIYYNRDVHSRQAHSPSQFWNDGLIGKFPRPFGGALLQLSPQLVKSLVAKDITINKQISSLSETYDYWEIISKPIHPSNAGKRNISHEGIQVDNFIYTSEVYQTARRKGNFNSIKFEDGQKVTVRYSRDDIRYIWIEHQGGYLKLQAYKYLGDDSIWTLVDRGIIGEYSVSKRNIDIMISILEKSINPSHLVSDGDLEILDLINKEFQKKGRINKKYREYLEQNFPGKTIAGAILELQEKNKLVSVQSTYQIKQTREEDYQTIVSQGHQGEDEEESITEIVYLDDLDIICEEEDDDFITEEEISRTILRRNTK